jgi:hypothetical protein
VYLPSLLPMKRGIVDACTGVILPNPMVAIASKIHSAKGGVRASHALGSVFFAISGAMAYTQCRRGRRVLSPKFLSVKIPDPTVFKIALAWL